MTVICGDSLLELAKLPHASIDALISDPPYSSGGMVRGDRAGAPLQKYVSSENQHRYAEDFAGDGRDQRGFQLWCAQWIATVLPALKPGAPVALFIDWRNLPALADAFQAGGLVWRGIFVWDKGEGVRPQVGRPRGQCEYVVWGSKGPFISYEGAPVLPGCYRCANVASKQREHIAQKPLDLMRLLVKLAPPGGTVLDPFCGSGSTLVAAAEMGRVPVGIEMTSHWAEVARQRLAEVQHGVPRGALFGGAA